jgi:tripartite-type tricarboxylate transporter receptor subunit TctC
LNSVLKIKPTGVPFNGTGPAMNALVGGQVDYMCDQIVNAVPQIKGGTIKAYAIATPERNPSLPDVPTTTEAGLPSLSGTGLERDLRAEGHAEAPIVAKLNAALVKALDDEGVKQAPARPRQRDPEAGRAHPGIAKESWSTAKSPSGRAC